MVQLNRYAVFGRPKDPNQASYLGEARGENLQRALDSFQMLCSLGATRVDLSKFEEIDPSRDMKFVGKTLVSGIPKRYLPYER